MWTGSVTGSHADNSHGVAGLADLVRFTLPPYLHACPGRVSQAAGVSARASPQ
jgi:hypothetical protein